MTVSQRAQYLYGKSVVDLGRSIWQERLRPGALEATRRVGASAGPALDPAPGASHGDLRQAEYYQEMLEDLRAAVNDELAHHCASLVVRETNGDASGVRRSQRIVHVKETELAAIDQLIDALSSRFPTSRIHYRNPDDPLPGEDQRSFASHQPSSSAPRELPMTLDSPVSSEATVSDAEGA
ncbi:MAG: hypothetical protein CK429_33940 [Mycobacterium sp.]|jgi:hypothetical protein|uniref:hypothetical protein n=1 Tax=Mycolicibacterium TaxID=1866885 RepID=UPI000CC75B46|nr:MULTISPECIES: hypothetical protein [Mycolicibacterium]MBX9983428.1 hypothetical protein [Mycobacterium gordonae]MCV7354603.1 hypothetical protein [Mycolicibacterium fluoranthenivorans]MCX2714353.1 hypothetical protein [Mycolicibacterium sp. J2]PJE02842.1 MAG: hypothetical protein CK429_33940 [Mycobacterium sp.]